MTILQSAQTVNYSSLGSINRRSTRSIQAVTRLPLFLALSCTQLGSSALQKQARISLHSRLEATLSATLNPVLGSFSVWTIDMRAMTYSDPPTQPSMRIFKVMHIDSAMYLNGMTTLQPQLHITAGQSNQLSTLLIADSLQSVVYHLNLQTPSYSIVLNDSATMAPPPNAIPAIGINSLHYRPVGGNLYY